MIRNLICVPAILCLFHTAAASADVVLVEDGRVRAKIYVSAEVMADDKKPAGATASRDVESEKQRQRLRESVKDLALYLEKISGAPIEIVTSPPAKESGTMSVLIGDLAVKEFGPPKKTAPYKQGFRFVVSPGRVGMMGESDLATSYAVYELLDRLGCRWYMPSDLGEVIPKLKTVALAETDFSSAPGTIYRGIWYADEAYRRRNRHGGLLLSAGHALEGYVTKEQRLAHPEWIAEVGGKPHPRRLKWSNPAVADAIADYWLNSLDKNAVPSISLSPDDGIDFDESKEDRAIDANDFDTTSQSTSLTDRLLVLCNRVAERVEKKHPEVLFGMLAYGPTTRPPVREKVHPNIVPQLAPITYSRAHPMSMDEVPDNLQLRNLVEGWGKAARGTSVYFYAWFLAEPAAPNPMIAKWSVDVPYVLKHNCQFWQPETTANFETSLHALYLGSRLAWNPTLKPADIIEELNSRFYGNAAKEMTAYWNFIDEVWVKTPEYSGCGFGYLRRWTPERLERARHLMNDALAACQTAGEVQRVKLADESLELFELFMKLRRDQAEGRFSNLAADADYWRKRIRYLGEKYQDQFCFTRMTWNPGTLSGSYFAQFYQQTYDDASRLAKDFQILTPQPLREFKYQADKDKTGESQGWAKTDFGDSSWKTTDVCVDTWSALGYHAWFKSMWYRTEVKLPPTPQGKKVFLWLGSTDGSAKVFVNGQHIPYNDAKKGTIDEFEGYCQPASFDITAAIKPNASTQISILCTRTFFNELGTGGLLGPVVVYREK
jgi:hypothetical protein